MANSTESIVIIGASLAGGAAAVALRDGGYQGEITLLGTETHRPYERPPLSKALLLGDADEPDWVGEDGFFDSAVTWLPGTTATAIDTDRHIVVAGAAEYPYQKLIIATGSTPRRLDLPGGDLAGVLTLRTLDDALALRERFAAGGPIAVIGAGWIGCEVAAAARKHGAAVTMIAPEEQPLVRVLGEQVGAVFGDLHREHGVELRLGASVQGFEGDGSISGVRLGDGTVVPAQTVVLGVGAVPNVALAEAAGLDLADGGIAVDPTLRTSEFDVYAIGDIAAHDHPRYPGRVRVEHWANAKDQGAHVAANVLGAEKPYQASPYFFTDQYDLGCEYRGLADPDHDRLVVRGDLAGREFIAFWVRDGVVTAAMNVNDWDHGDALGALVDSGRQVTDDELINGELG
ncbi:NAD(P)/FAD-dependent oxidoreductase [Microlunatus parietis]|uniref:NADPH-dependent 2,4-dienoyl-CoA reductase/sulfur reductase-like enzyme n=1 Tax=Microlunatus parietis TaxID=682979 RepID=A0A7Y9I7V0_9ACTN|nr:FAD/NAD(P)-binding oxidoreductase [Microlunatus parietis]NYE71787.1 NADPH-dependent 2,4-dienoyl-CoA reductase/sulfur reductase-like enzyme [Microlunatus parietis]